MNGERNIEILCDLTICGIVPRNGEGDEVNYIETEKKAEAAEVGVGAESTKGGRSKGRSSKCKKQSVSRCLLLSVQLPSVNVAAGDPCKMRRFSLFLPLRQQRAEVRSRR